MPKIQAAAPSIKKPPVSENPSTTASTTALATKPEDNTDERRPTLNRAKIALKSVNISKILKPEPTAIKEEVRTDYSNKDFTEADLLATWSEYAELVKNTDLDIYTTLTKNAPTLIDGNTIQLKIFNKAQEHDLTEIKAELLTFVRNKLNNFDINLSTFIEKGAEEKGLYTSSDKYKRLVEKNALLEELRSKLDLEIGF